MERKPGWKVIVPLAVLICLPAGRAQAQSSNSQMMKIPPPPNREIDPQLRFKVDPAAALTARQAAESQNAKRRQLIVWATNELVVLSERADQSATSSSGQPSKSELAADVDRIEALAKNLALAMKAK